MSSIDERCALIHESFRSLKRFNYHSLERSNYQFHRNMIPLNGVYVFFEKGEFSHGGDRIVRVGTHTGNNQLRSRLTQHLVKENKDRSIFRKNIGRAYLEKNKDDELLKMWNIDMTPKKARENPGNYVPSKIKRIEELVSTYMHDNLSFSVIEVVDKSERMKLESKLISTISWCNICKPSSKWLGNFSPKPKISKSGLWLENELYKEPFTDAEVNQFLNKYFTRQ